MSRNLRIPSYRHHKPSGRAVVTLSGQDHYLGTHGSPESKAKYERVVAEWLANGRRLRPEAGAGLTLKAALASYLAFAQAYYRNDGQTTSQIDRVKRAIAIALELYGELPIATFTPVSLKAVRQRMINRGWCRNVINQRVQCLVRAFKWLAGEDLIPAQLWHALQAVEGLRAGRSEAPELPQVPPAPEAAIAAAKPYLLPVLRDVIDLQLLTAMRPGEVVRMRACDIDRSAEVWIYSPSKHKGKYRGLRKPILIGPSARQILLPYLDRAATPESFLFSARAAVEARLRELGRKVRFGRERTPGERYQVTSYSHAVLQACRKADRAARKKAIEEGMGEDAASAYTFVPDWHPHQLRHNAATRLAAQFGIETARVILGHRHVSTTELYAQEDMCKAAAAIGKVG